MCMCVFICPGEVTGSIFLFFIFLFFYFYFFIFYISLYIHIFHFLGVQFLDDDQMMIGRWIRGVN